MRIAKTDIPARITIPGATARQIPDFGDASGYGAMGAEYFSLGQGTDIAPLLQGLTDDLCQAPHWGYLIQGEITVTYKGGAHESVRAGDMFFWPPGHTVRVEEDAEVVLFSPQHEHGQVMDHMQKKLAGGADD